MRLGVLAAVFAAGLALSCRGSEPECEVGSAGCACIAGTGCNPGLTCLSTRCVDTSGLGGRPGGIDGGAPAGNSDASTPTMGDAAVQVDGPGAADGSVSPDAPPPPPSCADSAGCGADEVCAIKLDGTGVCVKGSGKACATGDLCIKGIGLQEHPGTIEGSVCKTAGDCRQEVGGHLNGLCIKGNGSGSCVPLCQYRGDPDTKKCVTHPQIGVWDRCSRDQVRSFLAAVVNFSCVGYDTTAWTCLPSPPAISPEYEWTLKCTEDVIDRKLGCTSFAACFLELSPMTAKLGVNQFFEQLRRQIGYMTKARPGGETGSAGKCTSDCSCGRCGYCESGTCRYGGEGPYGCYRGCG